MDASEMLDTGEFDSETSGEDEESGSDEEMQDVSDDDEDSEYEGALDKLSSFVDGLESKKRKADEEGGDGGKKKKRVVLKERTEAWPEGEFVAVSAPDGVAQSKCQLLVG